MESWVCLIDLIKHVANDGISFYDENEVFLHKQGLSEVELILKSHLDMAKPARGKPYALCDESYL